MTPGMEGASEEKELPITLTAVQETGMSHCSPGNSQTQSRH